ncbi:MAG: CoA transferase [Nitrospirae bacterium]|nr:CoA transferase [Nitrospirota bacterium]
MEKGRGPLSGIRVLDLTQTVAGPFGSMILGDLGAEVIKIEHPNSPDIARSTPPHFIKGESIYFFSLNRNKKSLALDLKHPDGRKVFEDLVKKSDVVFHNFRPGTMERLGIGYGRLRRIHPRLVFCALTGYGLTGPWSSKPGYDYVIQAMSGMMSITGEPGGPPVKTGISMVDHVGGLYSALGVVAALWRRQATGRGDLVDVGLLDTQMSLFTYLAAYYLNAGEKPGRVAGSGHPHIIPVQNFRAKDGTLVVMAMNDRFWRNLCKGIGKPEWGDDPRFNTMAARYRHRRTLLPALKAILVKRTVADWVKRLEKCDVVCGPVSTMDRAFDHPQVKSRGTVVTLHHPTAGRIRAVGSAVKFTQASLPTSPPPRLGEHTRDILRKVLGYTLPKISALAGSGVVRTLEKSGVAEY